MTDFALRSRVGVMTAIPDFVDALRREQRAARHTVSLVLGVHAIAVALLPVANSHFEWRLGWWAALVPAAVYVVLWLAVKIRQRLTGMGGGRDGFGVMAILALVFALAFPFSFVAVLMAGPGTFLGLGLVVIGARLHARPLWGPGLGLMAVSPLVALGTIDNHAAFLGDQPGTLVLAVLSAALAALAGYAYRTERNALQGSPLL